jgi:predicted amidophosphoribosyltransferase
MLDNFCKIVSDQVSCKTTTIILRIGGNTKVIASFGLSILQFYKFQDSHYVPRDHRIFSLEIENVQEDARFAGSAFVKASPDWKYGAMVAIPHDIEGDVDLELWCADSAPRKPTGAAVKTMRKYAKLVGNAVALMLELRQLSIAVSDRDTLKMKLILSTAVTQSTFKAALIDHKLSVIAASPAMLDFQKSLNGPDFVAGQGLDAFWLDETSTERAMSAMDSEVPLLDQKSRIRGGLAKIRFDLHSSRFGESGECLGLLTVQESEAHGPSAMLSDSSRDLPDGDGAGPVTKFLLETLAPKSRILNRKSQHYLATRSWRAPIKQYQIAALKSLKSDPPAAFLEAAARDVVQAIRNVHGVDIGKYVVPVPCGHSGENCFSRLLARAVADQLALEFVDAFACQPIIGSSHPKQNVRRPRMKLLRELDGPVILVDDVATSGDHIEEASRLLKKTASTVWPVAWVAG